MAKTHDTIDLTTNELREITRFAVECAQRALPIFEHHCPDDMRPRDAIEAAFQFSQDGKRSNALRAKGFAAYKAAREASSPAAAEAAQAATQAVGAAYLHPLASSLQVKHILGAAAHAARAAELDADPTPTAEDTYSWALQHAPAVVATVLKRYPAAPTGGGRTGEIIRQLDTAIRNMS